MKKYLLMLMLIIGVSFAKPLPLKMGIVVSGNVGLTLGYDHYKLELYGNALSIDRYLDTFVIQKDLSWYYGAGAGIIWQNNLGFDLRTLIGLDWRWHPHFDLFIEAVPTLFINPNLNFNASYTLGVRYIF